MGMYSSSVSAEEDAKVNVITKGSVEETPGSVELQNLTTAEDLVRYGRESKSPIALLTAAELLGTVPCLEGEDKHVETKENEVKPEDAEVDNTQESPLPSDPLSLIEEAKTMSENNPNIVALAEELTKKLEGITPPAKGEIDGPYGYYNNWIPGYSTDTWTLVYYGNSPAEVAVSSMTYGDDLDLYVYDEYYNYITAEDSNYCDSYASWWPSWTGTFYVDVKNYQGWATYYDLYTN